MARAILILSFASIITTLLVFDNLASSSVCPVNGIPALFMSSLLIGQVTIASNSFEITFATESSNISIIYLAELVEGFPGSI